MKIPKSVKKRMRRSHQAVRGGTTRLINPSLASPPATNGNGGQGILRPNTGQLKLPDSLVEAGDNKPHKLMPGPFMLTIALLAVIFIAIIAWFVSQMPGK